MSNLEDHIQNETARLDRIEKKIDKLTDAMIEFAKTEQKIIAIEQQQIAAYERMNKHSIELDLIKEQSIKNTHTLRLMTFITGVIFTAMVGIVSKMFIG